MQVLSRAAFLVGSLMVASTPSTRIAVQCTDTTTGEGDEETRVVVDALNQEKTAVFHTPPPPHETDRTYYDDYSTVFGDILRGQAPAIVLAETDTLLAFQDRTPRADLHALIITKNEMGSVFDLNESHLDLLHDMKDLADSLLEQGQGKGKSSDTDNDKSSRLVFHVPPFHSVNHLHLHVLAPVSSMSWYGKLKYWEGTRWCASWQSIVDRLENVGGTAVPYKRPRGY